MAKNLNKLGIKFRFLADAETECLCKGKPYLKKDLTRNKESNSANANILFCLVTKPKLSRRQFLLQLIEELF